MTWFMDGVSILLSGNVWRYALHSIVKALKRICDYFCWPLITSFSVICYKKAFFSRVAFEHLVHAFN
jgi:hypothetical protein